MKRKKKPEEMSTVELANEVSKGLKKVDRGIRAIEEQVSDLIEALHGRRLYAVPPPKDTNTKGGP